MGETGQAAGPRRRRGGKGRERKRTRGDEAAWKETSFVEIQKENASFEAYYKSLGILPEAEWGAFMESLRSGLPTTFRVTGHRQGASAGITRQLEEVFVPSIGADVSLHRLPWYEPAGLGWHLESGKKALRSEPQFASFHKWLVGATENGDISRQEAVSMIPPLFMDVRTDHLVLDMCAAPGSKTAQLVEAMHGDAISGGATTPRGLVIANDADQQRAYMLYHQVRRLLSPSLLVTNNDGTQFPTLIRRKDGAAGEDDVERIRFDRILADVPCSGDGTFRKNIKMWKTWTPNLALGLHSLQVRLLEKAARLLKVGGRLVYSTCSLNIVENEAVVAAVLERYSHALELVDVSSELVRLIRRPGRASWRIPSRDYSTSYGASEEVPEGERKRYPRSIFAKPSYDGLSLDRCMSIYPHLQNTGGFFVAVIHKRAEISGGSVPPPSSHVDGSVVRAAVNEAAEGAFDEELARGPGGEEERSEEAAKGADEGSDVESDEESAEGLGRDDAAPLDVSSPANDDEPLGDLDEAASTAEAVRPPKKGAVRYGTAPEGEFRILSDGDAVMMSIFEWYGIDPAAIAVNGFGWMVRSEREPIKTITLTSRAVNGIMAASCPNHRQDSSAKGVQSYNGSLRIVNAGVRAFEIYESNYRGGADGRPGYKCAYRILSEVIPVLRPLITKRIIAVTREDMQALLKSPDSVVIGRGSGEEGASFEVGGAVAEYRATTTSEEGGDAACQHEVTVAIPVWCSHRGVKAFVPEANRPALLFQLA